MKKLTSKQLTRVNNNLNYWFNKATKQDIKEGLEWYQTAHDICKDIALQFDTTTLIAAQVISALSPRNKWDKNIKDSYKVFEAVQYGIHPVDIRCSTFHSNKFKAFNLIANNLQITENSLKTFNFVQNIAFLSSEHITVDIWHLRACFSRMIKIDKASIGKIAYQQIKELTLKKANKLGIKGYQLQAIIWNSIRNN